MKSKETSEKIYKRVVIRIIAPPGAKDERIVQTAPPGHGYNSDTVLGILEQVADTLERQNPKLEFRLVELEPNRFNFIYMGPRSEAIAKAS
jgi:hypothetical protein